MAIFDLRITLHRAQYASTTDFKHDVEGYCREFYRQQCQCAVQIRDDLARIYVSSNERNIDFDHSISIGCVQIKRGDFSEDCGIDMASLSNAFDEDGALDLMLSKLKRTTRYISGHIRTVDKVAITPEILRQNDWDTLDGMRRVFLLRRLLVDLSATQYFDYIQLSDEDGPTGDIYSLIGYSVDEIFGPDAESIWGDSDDYDDD